MENCLKMFVLLLTIGIVGSVDHSAEVQEITQVLDQFYQRLGQPDMAGDSYTRFYTEDALLNIAGKTAHGHDEIWREENEIIKKNYQIDSYNIERIKVNGNSGSATVRGMETVEGASRPFQDVVLLTRDSAGEWKFEVVVVVIDLDLAESTEN